MILQVHYDTLYVGTRDTSTPQLFHNVVCACHRSQVGGGLKLSNSITTSVAVSSPMIVGLYMIKACRSLFAMDHSINFEVVAVSKH